ncbi:type IV pili methyl-accepting chemotaxis transducer N-terminal domain-containing protein [Candidatus Venteria ishoeyi]|uniref:type IV pili methyl-accepting chemotaxis transducer N-terminal domain-containing protein n=1 Tax=Candidatus Venteria ishoeyi TaxID=1899563 RepID=UPI0025A5EA3C|nr:type IV pili methyl-accepting chemotaxis transducer N-terminal domain-containing protein [Candidatus Venteria ishoeyi]MDM8545549.1 type IV pili methyl-accepting chemotaxis transducer N-terminal domain-containing protein [Candidatus Venteria ishoeyi]
MIRAFFRYTAATLLGLSLAFSAQASSKTEMGKVINLAGKQRMLTQKMSKEALFIAKGVDATGNQGNLKKTANLFDRTLKGLKDGDADLGLPKTTDAGILAQLDVVAKLWITFKGNIDAVLAGKTSPEVLSNIAAQNLPLLKEMNKAVKMYEKAAGSTLDAGMATTINLAGKQRMLTQKMTKELMLAANGIDAQANITNMKKTANLFGSTLNGLVKADKAMGLPGTTDQAILTQLAVVSKIWAEYQPILEKNAADANADFSQVTSLNMTLLKEMNKAVQMYAASVK